MKFFPLLLKKTLGPLPWAFGARPRMQTSPQQQRKLKAKGMKNDSQTAPQQQQSVVYGLPRNAKTLTIRNKLRTCIMCPFLPSSVKYSLRQGEDLTKITWKHQTIVSC